MRRRGLDMLTARQYGQERRLAPHGLAGQILLQEWLQEKFGLGARVTGQLAVVAGGHHGVPPESRQVHDAQLRPHLLRHPGPSEEVWRSTQFELLDWCAEFTGVAPLLSAWGEVRLSQPAQVLLTAVVILADWIASAPELFPYAPESWQPAGPVGRLGGFGRPGRGSISRSRGVPKCPWGRWKSFSGSVFPTSPVMSYVPCKRAPLSWRGRWIPQGC